MKLLFFISKLLQLFFNSTLHFLETGSSKIKSKAPHLSWLEQQQRDFVSGMAQVEGPAHRHTLSITFTVRVCSLILSISYTHRSVAYCNRQNKKKMPSTSKNILITVVDFVLSFSVKCIKESANVFLPRASYFSVTANTLKRKHNKELIIVWLASVISSHLKYSGIPQRKLLRALKSLLIDHVFSHSTSPLFTRLYLHNNIKL